MNCYICDTNEDADNEIKHYCLYVNGSEGVELCVSCQIAVCEQIRHMKSAANKAKINYIKSTKVT